MIGVVALFLKVLVSFLAVPSLQPIMLVVISSTVNFPYLGPELAQIFEDNGMFQ